LSAKHFSISTFDSPYILIADIAAENFPVSTLTVPRLALLVEPPELDDDDAGSEVGIQLVAPGHDDAALLPSITGVVLLNWTVVGAQHWVSSSFQLQPDGLVGQTHGSWRVRSGE